MGGKAVLFAAAIRQPLAPVCQSPHAGVALNETDPLTQLGAPRIITPFSQTLSRSALDQVLSFSLNSSFGRRGTLVAWLPQDRRKNSELQFHPLGKRLDNYGALCSRPANPSTTRVEHWKLAGN